MPAELVIYNSQGHEQINTTNPVGGVVGTLIAPQSTPGGNGLLNTTVLKFPVNFLTAGEAPLILARVPVGHWVGGLIIGQNSGTDFYVSCTANVELACCYSRVTPIIVPGANNALFEVYNAAGQLTFSSRYRYPRLTAIVVPPTNGTYGFTNTGQHPWIAINNLTYAYDVSEFGPNRMFAARLDSFGSLTIEARDALDIYNPWPSNPGFGTSPYSTIPLHVPIAVIPGV